MLTGTSSLRQHALEKCLHSFDTVIIDDANLVNEADCLSALRHGAIRLIILGNPAIDQSMFLLRSTSTNKTLFNRIHKDNFLVMAAPENRSTAASPTKGKSKKHQAAPPKPKIEYVFVDSSQSRETLKKDSFENLQEANAVVDYLFGYQKSIDFNDLAVMSPFRTQVLVIKDVIQEARKDELPKQISSFSTIGSFEEFVSRKFKTIIVSVCKTEDFEELGGPLLNSQEIVDFLISRVALPVGNEASKIVIISKSESLNDLWRKTFYEAEGVEIIEL